MKVCGQNGYRTQDLWLTSQVPYRLLFVARHLMHMRNWGGVTLDLIYTQAYIPVQTEKTLTNLHIYAGWFVSSMLADIVHATMYLFHQTPINAWLKDNGKNSDVPLKPCFEPKLDIIFWLLTKNMVWLELPHRDVSNKSHNISISTEIIWKITVESCYFKHWYLKVPSYIKEYSFRHITFFS